MKRNRLIGMTVAALFGASCWSIGSNTTRSEPADTPKSNLLATSVTPTPRSTVSPSVNSNMTQTTTRKSYFESLPSDFSQPTDDAGKLLLREYGSLFIARGGVTPPKKVVFKDENDVLAFQNSISHRMSVVGAKNIDLQNAAMAALENAVKEAKAASLTITPRGSDPARRSYQQTVVNWNSRVKRGFQVWTAKGKVSDSEAKRISSLSPYEQVPEIFKLESQQIYFALNQEKSIIYSVAPPGTSQHISMLALDIEESGNANVRAILAKNGWFQTITSDLPHFTFLGVSESELTALGLKKVINGGRDFWVPDI